MCVTLGNHLCDLTHYSNHYSHDSLVNKHDVIYITVCVTLVYSTRKTKCCARQNHFGGRYHGSASIACTIVY